MVGVVGSDHNPRQAHQPETPFMHHACESTSPQRKRFQNGWATRRQSRRDGGSLAEWRACLLPECLCTACYCIPLSGAQGFSRWHAMGTLNNVRSAASTPRPGVSCMQERGLLFEIGGCVPDRNEWKRLPSLGVLASWRLGALVLTTYSVLVLSTRSYLEII